MSMAASMVFVMNASALAVFTVNSNLDEVDDNVSDDICHTVANTCTLRAAVMQANKITDAVTIVLPADVYKLRGPAGADLDDSGDLNLGTPALGNPTITITGAGAATTIIDGNLTDRVLNIASGRSANISGVSIVNGVVTSADGGGVLNRGDLTLSDSTISHCQSILDGFGGGDGGGIRNQFNAEALLLVRVTVKDNQAYDGGGISSNASLAISQSTLSGNDALSWGGGLFSGYPAVIERSTIAGNSAYKGGGIFVYVGYPTPDTMVVTNSTISENNASVDGGGIFNAATTNIYNTTIAFNQADADADFDGTGAGIFDSGNAGVVFNMHSSVVAGNYLSGYPVYSDCEAVVGFYGNNRLGYADGCSVAAGSSGGAVYLVHSLNELGFLKDNGGPTQTIALVPPSNMIDAGIATLECLDQKGQPLATDQRGRPRIIGAYCDIGAYEYDDVIFANGFQ
jgi:hypothetical protein